jgi:hypothetical protein
MNYELRTKLLRYIQDRGDEVTSRQLVRNTRWFDTTGRAVAALNEFVRKGWGTWETRKNKTGRPKTVFILSNHGEIDTTDEPMPFDTVETDDTMSIAYYGEKWLTKDEILQQLNLDQAIWKVDKVEYRGWEVTGKMHQGQVTHEDTTTWLPQKLWKSKNRYIALRLVRHAPKNIQDGIQALLDRASWPKSPTPKRSTPGRSVLELSLYDVHLGKYCWGAYTGESYDNKIASSTFMNAASDLLHRTSHHDIDRVIIPIGHDFFQVDNWLGATTAGTIVESTDTRFTKTFQVGIDSFCFCIDECLKVAPVELIYVPGNHDQSTAFYLSKVLENRYYDNKHVTVDTEVCTGHNGRKYRRFGCTLLGYVHGAQRDCPKDRDLPLLMATEQSRDFAETLDRAWRLGHLHTKRTSIVPVGDIFNGVRVERIPSLSATDAWHFDNGFTGNRRAAIRCLPMFTRRNDAQHDTTTPVPREPVHQRQ